MQLGDEVTYLLALRCFRLQSITGGLSDYCQKFAQFNAVVYQ
jgi:hypothetical protein